MEGNVTRCVNTLLGITPAEAEAEKMLQPFLESLSI